MAANNAFWFTWSTRPPQHDGVEFMTFSEGPTKTRQGGLRVKPRLPTPKVVATGEKRCPVALVKEYLEKCPVEMKKTGPFYLAVIDKRHTSAVWYRKKPLGKNKINNIMKTMKEAAKRFLPQKEANQPQRKKGRCEEIEKLRYSEMLDQKHNGLQLRARLR